MGLNGLLDIELRVPNPDELMAFWMRHGLERTSDGVLGTVDRPVQLRVAEGSYRHLSLFHLSCSTEQDLVDIARRLELLGVVSTVVDTRLTCVDPVFGHEVVVEVTAPHPLSPAQQRAWNNAGMQGRVGERANVITEATARRPRRLGHIVLGTQHIEKTTAFYIEGLGIRISDQVKFGRATFGRVEQDHHSLVIQPAPTSYINHYAWEMDDIDAIGKAGQAVMDERCDANVVGIGRHFIGSNIFWYMTDPAGNMFEFFSDIDQIVDEQAWERDQMKLDWGGADGPAPVSVWGPQEPETFMVPADLPVIAAAREAQGLM